jgi:hypothetical protein
MQASKTVAKQSNRNKYSKSLATWFLAERRIQRRSINEECIATHLRLKSIYISVRDTVQCQIKGYFCYGTALLKLSNLAKTEKKGLLK